MLSPALGRYAGEVPPPARVGYAPLPDEVEPPHQYLVCECGCLYRLEGTTAVVAEWWDGQDPRAEQMLVETGRERHEAEIALARHRLWLARRALTRLRRRYDEVRFRASLAAAVALYERNGASEHARATQETAR